MGRAEEATTVSGIIQTFKDSAAASLRRALQPLPQKETQMAGPQSVARLGARYKEVMQKIGDHADKLSARVDKLDASSDDTFTRHERVLDQIDRDMSQMEDFMNQLSNGGPPLEDTAHPSKPSSPDRNGVSTASDAQKRTDVDHNGVTLNKG